MTTALQQVQAQLAEMATTLGQAIEQEEQETSRRQANGHASQSSPASSRREDALLPRIDAAYKELAATRRKLVRAENARRRYEQRARVDNADNLVAAKNERVAQLYLEGILDKDEYRRLLDQEKAAELDHFEARAEVERLQLVVKLLRAGAPVEQEEPPARERCASHPVNASQPSSIDALPLSCASEKTMPTA